MSELVILYAQYAELAAAATVLAFACLLGGNLGSFLNVVMHRVPRGESVATGGSRCPACGSAVRWHDNVPVLGWLRLGGRCRDCQSPISIRYPLVEAAAAVLGAVIGGMLLGGGRLVPGERFAAVAGGADALLLNTDWSFIIMRLSHAILVFILLAWAICEIDRLRVTPIWFAVALGLLGGLAVITGGPLTMPGWPAAQDAALGAGIAAVFAVAFWAVLPSRWLAQALMLAGASLGWQALATTVLLMVLTAACRITARRIAVGYASGRHPGLYLSCCDLLAAVCIQLLAWRWLASG
jgi:leader peptidase (prepilin peptidase)/N-methyltransferase